MPELHELLTVNAALAESALTEYLGSEYAGDTVLADAMRYAVLGGGKRIRAFLVLEFCRMFGGTVEAALPYAAAIEMIHAYSLVHDDLPCMDNDDIRRGKPSCHKAFGEANALLAGDTLLTQAFEIAAVNPYVSHGSVRLAVRELARGAGALGMAGGQYYDLSDTCGSYDELLRLQSMKTGALIRTACLLGYYAAVNEPSREVMDDITVYAHGLGLAFQITDDLLDVRGDAVALGKPIGSDAKNGKKTILSFLSADESEKLAMNVTETGCSALKKYPGSETLCELAYYLLNRKN